MQNPITKFFNKIEDVSLYGDYSKNIEWLEAMKKVHLYAKNILISSNNAEELENLTDPNLHNTPINNFQLRLYDSFKISSKALENLQAIYPNLITLIPNHWTDGLVKNQVLLRNFIKLLTKLDQTSLEMESYKNNFDFKLEFKDAIWKIVESKEECFYIRAKLVEIRCFTKGFSWIK